MAISVPFADTSIRRLRSTGSGIHLDGMALGHHRSRPLSSASRVHFGSGPVSEQNVGVTSAEQAHIYEVRAQSDDQTRAFGARRTYEEASILLAESKARVENAGGHNDRYWIEEIDTTGLFSIPPRPTPRERYSTRIEEKNSAPGTWTTVHVDVLDGVRVVGAYDRNYRMLQTFEPFRQGDRHFALISTNYTATSVMDLANGQIIAEEEPNAGGFCPVGFYVPDWWDIHSERELPGSTYWTKDNEWPTGDFGFVWGCIWGDDSSWKVQYLDLSGIQDGILRREERFGYVPLAIPGYLPPVYERREPQGLHSMLVSPGRSPC